MSNVLKVSHQTTIYSLAERGWSQRRIARELGIDRETVGRHLRLRAKPAISIAASAEPDPPKPAISIPGAGAGRRSHCERFASVIREQVEAGLSAQRIYQELVVGHGFSDSYQSVQRFVRKLKETHLERVWRME